MFLVGLLLLVAIVAPLVWIGMRLFPSSPPPGRGPGANTRWGDAASAIFLIVSFVGVLALAFMRR